MSCTIGNVDKNKKISTTLDDTWIVCDSKSYPGLKYYINKLTGIKVWNINETEIAFAAEKGDQNCPERKSPIMNQPNEARNGRVYNNQIINNQFSNQLSNMLVNPVPIGSSFNVWDPPIVTLPVPAQQSYTLVPTVIAQAYQQYLPLTNNFQNAGLPVSYNPQQYPHNQHTTQNMAQHAQFRNNMGLRTNDTFDHTHATEDLREKLRRKSESVAANKRGSINATGSDQSKESKWNERKRSEDTLINMNMASLKLLTSSGSYSNQWKIVVDTEILLQHFNYLNNMAAADKDCRMCVPHYVMAELRELDDVQSRRILRFLTQEIESGLFMLGEEVVGDSAHQKIMNTCIKLALQNNHVVLISANQNILRSKLYIKNIHVYSMQGIKVILKTKNPPMDISPSLEFKITVPNNIKKRCSAQNYLYDATALNTLESLEKTPRNTFESPETSPRNSFQSPETSPRNSFQSPETSPRNSFESSEKTSRNAFDLPKTTRQNIFDLHERATTSVFTKKALDQHSMKSTADCRIEFLKNLRERKPCQDNLIERAPQKTFESTERAKNTVCKKNVQSILNSKNCTLSPPKPGVIGGKHADTYVCKNNADCPKPISKSSFGISDTGTVLSALETCSVDNAKDDVQTSKLLTDNSSLCSTSTSGKMSQNSIQTKRSISLKRTISLKRRPCPRNILTNPPNHNIVSMKNVEMNPQTINKTRSISKSSDKGSVTSIEKTNSNIAIDKTSTSGIISNSENSVSEKVRNPIKQGVKKATFRTFIMFEVAGQSMEAVLKTRCDEWVFRFVQIMEEVLRVKLQEKLAMDNKEYPAPRDLQEAARCIIKKYSNFFNVVDAANKLSFILYKTSDVDGKIAVNIHPSDYMEMYSYGVFLVDTFLDVSADCKEKGCKKEKTYELIEHETDSCSCYEVKTAADSLKKLLYDIQNANHESFIDHTSDLPTENIKPDYGGYEMEIKKDMAADVLENLNDQLIRNTTNDLQCCDDLYDFNKDKDRSEKKRSQSDEAVDEAPTKSSNSDKNFEYSFFNSLHLKKKSDSNKSAEQNNVTVKKANVKRVGITKKLNEPKLKSNSGRQKLTTKTLINCSFKVNAELERKLKESQKIREIEDKVAENERLERLREKVSEMSAPNECVKNSGSNKKFNAFMGRVYQSVTKSFSVMSSLYGEYVQEVKNNTNSKGSTKQTKLHEDLELSKVEIDKMFRFLDGISKRDQSMDSSLQTILNGEDYVPDDAQMLQYRYLVNKLREHGLHMYNEIQILLNLIPKSTDAQKRIVTLQGSSR